MFVASLIAPKVTLGEDLATMRLRDSCLGACIPTRRNPQAQMPSCNEVSKLQDLEELGFGTLFSHCRDTWMFMVL